MKWLAVFLILLVFVACDNSSDTAVGGNVQGSNEPIVASASGLEARVEALEADMEWLLAELARPGGTTFYVGGAPSEQALRDYTRIDELEKKVRYIESRLREFPYP